MTPTTSAWRARSSNWHCMAKAAQSLGVACPEQPMRSSLLIDGSRWDGSDPYGYARSFSLHALGDLPDARVGA